MRTVDWLTVLVAVVATILIPVLVIVATSARRSGIIEQKLDDLAEDKADDHSKLERMISGLDARLRWLEERIWGMDPRYPRERRPPRSLPVAA